MCPSGGSSKLFTESYLHLLRAHCSFPHLPQTHTKTKKNGPIFVQKIIQNSNFDRFCDFHKTFRIFSSFKHFNFSFVNNFDSEFELKSVLPSIFVDFAVFFVSQLLLIHFTTINVKNVRFLQVSACCHSENADTEIKNYAFYQFCDILIVFKHFVTNCCFWSFWLLLCYVFYFSQ